MLRIVVNEYIIYLCLIYPTDEKESSMECLVPECDNTAISRGLCSTCARHAQRLVRQGLTTWKELIEKGKALPSQHAIRDSGRDRRSWFLG